jgi:hypothetical protein
MAKRIDLPPDHPSYNRIWIGPVILPESVREEMRKRRAAQRPAQPEKPEPSKPEPPKRGGA